MPTPKKAMPNTSARVWASERSLMVPPVVGNVRDGFGAAAGKVRCAVIGSFPGAAH
jgi:hypothetical protein